MIIKPKPLPNNVRILGAAIISKVFRRRFNKIKMRMPPIKPGHSYLLMCNHFSFLDGILAIYLIYNGLHKSEKLKGFYIMSLKRQMQKNPWLKYIGSFSIVPHSRTSKESLAYAAEVLSKPGNLLLFYPQAELESSHVRYIKFRDGIRDIVPQIKGDCQLLWCSITIEYFESIKPSVFFDTIDVGTNHDFDFDELSVKVNEHHLKCIKQHIRYTEEP